MLVISQDQISHMAAKFDWNNIHEACQNHIETYHPNSELMGEHGQLLVTTLTKNHISQLRYLTTIIDKVVLHEVLLPITYLMTHLPNTEHSEAYRFEALCLAIEKNRIHMEAAV